MELIGLIIGIIIFIILAIIMFGLMVVATAWTLQLTYGITGAVIGHYRDKRNKVTATVDGLGTFSTLDNKCWSGEMNDISISITSEGGPPTQRQVTQVKKIIYNLPRLTELGREYLGKNEEGSWLSRGGDVDYDYEKAGWLEGETNLFKPESIAIRDNPSDIHITFGHPQDSDGMYQVFYHNEVPVDCHRDD